MDYVYTLYCCKKLSDTLQTDQFPNARKNPKLTLMQRLKERLKQLEKRAERQAVKRKVKEMQEVELLLVPALLGLLGLLLVELLVVPPVEAQQEGQQAVEQEDYLAAQQVVLTESLVSRLPQHQ